MSDGVSLLRERRGGFALAPSTPSQCTLPCFWGFVFWLMPGQLTRTAGSLDKHAGTLCSCAQPNREKGQGRNSLVGSRGNAPWVPPINTRTLYAVVTNPIARRVSRGSKTLRGCRAEPCRSPEAEPLAPPLYTKNSYFPCKSTKFEPEFRLNSGGFFFECVLYYMNEGSVRCKTDRNQTPPFRNDDAGEVGIVE